LIDAKRYFTKIKQSCILKKEEDNQRGSKQQTVRQEDSKHQAILNKFTCVSLSDMLVYMKSQPEKSWRTVVPPKKEENSIFHKLSTINPETDTETIYMLAGEL
jgi:hypothetical protein